MAPLATNLKRGFVCYAPPRVKPVSLLFSHLHSVCRRVCHGQAFIQGVWMEAREQVEDGGWTGASGMIPALNQPLSAVVNKTSALRWLP